MKKTSPQRKCKVSPIGPTFGASEFLLGNVDKVDFSTQPLKLWVGDKELSAQSVIVASGASARWLGLESEITEIAGKLCLSAMHDIRILYI